MKKIKRIAKAETNIVYKKASKESMEQEDKEIAERSRLELIEDELEDEGIVLFNNDNIVNKYLILPADITDEDSRELGKFFNAFTQQKMWTRTLIGRLSTTIREKSFSLDDIKADVYSSLPPKLSVKEKELRFRTHPEAKEVIEDMFIYEEKLKMLSEYLDNLVDGIFNISREISRRGNDWKDNNREDNIGNIRRN